MQVPFLMSSAQLSLAMHDALWDEKWWKACGVLVDACGVQADRSGGCLEPLRRRLETSMFSVLNWLQQLRRGGFPLPPTIHRLKAPLEFQMESDEVGSLKFNINFIIFQTVNQTKKIHTAFENKINVV